MDRTLALLAVVLLGCGGTYPSGSGEGGSGGVGPGGSGGGGSGGVGPGGSGGGGSGGIGPGGSGGGGSGGTGGTGGHVAECGNGVVEPGEECDGGPDCDPDCTWKRPCEHAIDFFAGAIYDPDFDAWMLRGHVWDGSSRLEGTCGGGGPETVFVLDLVEPSRATWIVADPDVTQYADAVSYVMPVCSDFQASGCVTAATGTADLLAPGPGFLVVDTDDPGGGLEFTLLVDVIPFRFEGQPCDPDQAEDVCAPGLVCGNGRCVVNHRPVLRRAHVAWTDTDDALTITVQGEDVDGNADEIWLRLLDADGKPVLMDGQELQGAWPPDPPILGHVAFQGTLQVGVAGVPPFAQVEVAVEDTGELRSSSIVSVPQ